VLNISEQNLEGRLDLKSFFNLKKVNCSQNQLNSLDLTSCIKLEELNCNLNQLINLILPNCCQYLTNLYCKNNNLINLNFSVLNPEKLTNLSIRNNNFLESDLSIFSSFVNLETLYIGNDYQEKIEQNIYNRFAGSLDFLKSLGKLKSLHISNTDIDSGLEHLHENTEIICSFQGKLTSKVKKIAEQLR
jgi:hypothetical protein